MWQSLWIGAPSCAVAGGTRVWFGFIALTSCASSALRSASVSSQATWKCCLPRDPLAGPTRFSGRVEASALMAPSANLEKASSTEPAAYAAPARERRTNVW